MKREVIVTAKTLEQARELGAKELNLKEDDVTCELLERGKKGFLGIGSTENKFKVSGSLSNGDLAVGFIEKIIAHMKISAMPKIIGETENEIKIDIIGENLGTLIGYHGEILDSLQYLTYLAVNKDDDFDESAEPREDKTGAVKISIDIENYRKKREETLQSLAKKMADRVLKYGRSVTLEPMNAYERRIIHSTIQDINGVSTHSIGQENDRKIVISREGGAPVRTGFPRTNSGGSGFNPNFQQRSQQRRPRPYGDKPPDRNRPGNRDNRDRNFKKQ